MRNHWNKKCFYCTPLYSYLYQPNTLVAYIIFPLNNVKDSSKSQKQTPTSCISYTFCDFLMLTCNMLRTPLNMLRTESETSLEAKISPTRPSWYSNSMCLENCSDRTWLRLEERVNGSLGHTPVTSFMLIDTTYKRKVLVV